MYVHKKNFGSFFCPHTKYFGHNCYIYNVTKDHGVTVSTAVFGAAGPGSNPGGPTNFNLILYTK